ncbi:RHS repeat-associated core domain-containing protein [Microbulbifer aestuariivivens]|uniref:RHS repeat domain-containing protein n=1 Tax=Microbulbifer aestuariivivens TaxID=1908308 RepID=UPI0031EE61D7
MQRLELSANDEVTGEGIQYLHKDLQGSLDVITDGSGQVAEDAYGNRQVFSFDPWGKRRDRHTWAPIADGPSGIVAALKVGAFAHLSTNRGYTGHEMLDEVGLIHMNGRVYDPHLARFVSADPVIDGVTSVQGYNRYAYVHNNPLMYTDPSGYSSWNKFRDQILKPVVALAISYFLPGAAFLGGVANSLGAYMLSGAVAGAVTTGTMEGAFTGAFSAMVFYGIGSAFKSAGWAQAAKGAKGVWGTGLNGLGHA